MARVALILMLAISGGGVAITSQVQGHPDPYPVGTFCTPQGKLVGRQQTKIDPCKCKRHDDGNPDNPYAKQMCKAGEPVNPSHDPVCRQECQEQHCACPVSCDVPRHQ